MYINIFLVLFFVNDIFVYASIKNDLIKPKSWLVKLVRNKRYKLDLYKIKNIYNQPTEIQFKIVKVFLNYYHSNIKHNLKIYFEDFDKVASLMI